MIRLKKRDENNPNLKIKYSSGPNTTLPCFGNPAHGFSYLRDLVNTDATPCMGVSGIFRDLKGFYGILGEFMGFYGILQDYKEF